MMGLNSGKKKKRRAFKSQMQLTIELIKLATAMVGLITALLTFLEVWSI